MGWQDDPVARPGPVARPAPVARPGSEPRAAKPGRSTDYAPSPAWMNDPVAEPTAPQAEPKKEQALSWADVPSQALQNAPRSAVELGKAMVQPILHPVDTAKGIFDVGYGLASKLHGTLGGTQDPEAKAKDEAAANAVGEHFTKRYGSTDGFKKALAEDPVGVMADAAMVLMGGGAVASRAPGAISKVGEVARSAGSAIDPINNVGRAVSGVGTAAANIVGVTTGAGTRPFQEAFKAGREGNQAFTDNMRGKVQAGDVVDMADSAVAQMGKQRGDAYRANMAETAASTDFVNTTPVFKVINDARKMAFYQGVPRSADAVKVVEQIDGIVTEFTNLPGKPTAERFDAMKQAVGEVRQKTQQGTLERKIADNVYRGIKDQIVKQVPSYAKAMQDYSQASETINEARRALSVNDRATTDTTLRKLQSTMRDNVNTNWGERTRLMDELAQFEPNLPPALAGQALGAWAPRGLARYAAGTGAMAGAVTNPSNLALLPLASPRLMGELARGTGRGAGLVEQAAAALRVSPQMLANMARLGYVADSLTPANGDAERLAAALMGGQ